MSILHYQDLGNGIYCVDTSLYRPGHTAVYLIKAEQQIAIIDTGAANNVPGLLEVTREIGGGPEAVRYVMPTHVHLDHAGGAGTLMASCPNATLVVHQRGAQHLIDPDKLQAGATAVYGEAPFLRDFGKLEPVPAERVVAAADAQVFSLEGREILFLDTPGHANHHGCLYDRATGTLFTGDTFGLSYREFDSRQGPLLLATTTPVAFDPEAWETSLDRLLALNPKAACLTHFGRLEDPASVVDQLRTNLHAHVRVALAEEQEGEPGEGRMVRLEAAVEDLLLGRALEHCPGQDPERALDLLRMDIGLNAQGLAVWLQRRAKARGPAPQ